MPTRDQRSLSVIARFLDSSGALCSFCLSLWWRMHQYSSLHVPGGQMGSSSGMSGRVWTPGAALRGASLSPDEDRSPSHLVPIWARVPWPQCPCGQVTHSSPGCGPWHPFAFLLLVFTFLHPSSFSSCFVAGRGVAVLAPTWPLHTALSSSVLLACLLLCWRLM